MTEMVKTFRKSIEITESNPEFGVMSGFCMLSLEKSANGTWIKYEDQQGDHITERAILKACIDFGNSGLEMNFDHYGETVGKILSMFPLTSQIAKSNGIITPFTGVMVLAKPFRDDIYKADRMGFSIEGHITKGRLV